MPEPLRSALTVMEHTAKITEWNADKGYGWLQWGSKRLFLHCRDFSWPRRAPSVGEEVCFILGRDAQGRTCATRATFAHDRSTPIRMRELRTGRLRHVAAAWTRR
jgi:cold shock CspA family protein